MRADALAARANTEADAYSESIKLSKDIANILRQNIAQIQRVPGDEDVWSAYYTYLMPTISDIKFAELRLTEHSELGDNESVKQPKPIDIGPKGKRRTYVPIFTEEFGVSLTEDIANRCSST
jgi:peptide chain release factor